MRALFLSVVICFVFSSLSFAQGIIRGKVTDKTGETLIGVTISLKSNRSVGVATDLDGNYSFKIKDSTAQTLILSYVGYKQLEATVYPVKGEVLIRNFVLETAATDLNVVEITAKAIKANDHYMESFQKNSAATLNYVSAEMMKKSGDPNVTAAVTRVSGVSTNGSFITVRGIGDRYVKTTINGSRIPTLDPFTNNIKLDMFPASLVDNIIITKTASPDLPGDWAGAYLSVETKDYPEQLNVNVETSFGYNDQSSFKNVISSRRSDTDWMGYDKSLRDRYHSDFVPVIIAPTPYEEFVALGLGDYYRSLGVTKENWNEGSPTGDMYYKLGLVQLGLLAPANFDDANAVSAAKSQYYVGSYKSQAFTTMNTKAAQSSQSYPNNWNTTYRKAPLNFSQSFSIGNQVSLFGKPLGIIAGFRYGSTTLYDSEASSNRSWIQNQITGSVIKTNVSTEEISKESNGWSALANLAYKLNPNNSVSFLFMPNFTGVNNARYSINTIDLNEHKINKSQFYEQRKQLVYQFKSEHYIPNIKLKIEWNASYTDGKSSAPDFKNLNYTEDPVTKSHGIDQGSSRAFRYLAENIFDSRVYAELPIGNKPDLPRKLKLGAAYLDNRRDSRQYNYNTLYGPVASTTLGDVPIEDFFNLDKFGFNSAGNIDLYYSRVDYPSDHTLGFSKIKGGYAMIDYALIPVLRFSGGLRVEMADIHTDAYKYEAFGLSADDPRRRYPGEVLNVRPGKLNETCFLPSANIMFKIKKDESAPMNLRLNYSESTARPSIRELTDVVVYDYEIRGYIWGRSDLKIVRIKNYDLRLESYFKNGDNVSLSLFYKDFRDHIEIAEALWGYTWINVDKSWVKGVELEGRKSLTKRFELRANITWADSRTRYLQQQESVTNGERYIDYTLGEITRTMYGQAPYVINGIFGYKEDSLGLGITLSYNIQGPRLVIASFYKQLQVFELPRHLLDIKITKALSKHFNASLTIRDVLNAPIRRTYDYDEGWIVDYDNYRYGTNYILGISYKL